MFFFSSRRRHTRYIGDWSSDVCSSDLEQEHGPPRVQQQGDAERQRQEDGLADHEEDQVPALRPWHSVGALAPRDHRQEVRSEERRVGKEWRARRSAYHKKTKRSRR